MNPQNPMQISSPQNQRIKDLVRLRQRRDRDRRQVFLIEGYRAIRRAVDNQLPIKELYVCESLFLGENEADLIAACETAGATLFQVTEPVFRKAAYRDRPEGLLAVANQFHRSLDDLALDDHSLFIVGEAIEKPGNLGTMLRSADAAGAHGVVVCDACTDIFNPNVVCASIGTLFTVPVAECSSAAFLNWALAHQVQVVATTPHTDTVYTDLDLTGPTAIVMGTEQVGLTAQWLAPDAVVKALIPMYGQADSLNVATAATLVLFEAIRQRRAAGLLA